MRRPSMLLVATALAFAPACSRKERPIAPASRDSSLDSSTMTSPPKPPESAAPPSDESLRCPAALVAARKGGTDSDRFVAPSPAERQIMRDAIARLIKDGPSARAEVGAALAPAGFEIVDVAEMPGAILLRELPTRRRGGGAYVLSWSGRARATFVQAPHTFYDEGTLQLGCDLFQRTGARGFFIDTAHRYKSAAMDENGEHPADVAHNAATLFQAATEGILRAVPSATVVQVHGFAAREAKTMVVLSNGEKKAGDPLVMRAAAALAKPVGDGVRTYPAESAELGATTNVQGTAVRAAGGRFLHVEMEASLRRDLLADPRKRAEVLDALAAALEAR